MRIVWFISYGSPKQQMTLSILSFKLSLKFLFEDRNKPDLCDFPDKKKDPDAMISYSIKDPGFWGGLDSLLFKHV